MFVLYILFCCFSWSSRSKVMPNGGENLDYGPDGSSEETDSSLTKEATQAENPTYTSGQRAKKEPLCGRSPDHPGLEVHRQGPRTTGPPRAKASQGRQGNCRYCWRRIQMRALAPNMKSGISTVCDGNSWQQDCQGLQRPQRGDGS